MRLWEKQEFLQHPVRLCHRSKEILTGDTTRVQLPVHPETWMG